MSQALESKDKALADAIKAKDQIIQDALEKKDKTIADLELQLKTQKMSMDAQMMELNQTILQKDALLMEFMSSRNNSREVIAAAASMSPSTVVPAASVTNTYYHSNQSEAQLQMSQVRDYMLSSSSDEEDDELTETIRMSYSTDEEEQEEHTQPIHGHFRHMNETHLSTPQSPAETISSSVSFDSDEEEEKVAEIKRFSYNSVQSQDTRPISLISTVESIASNHSRNSIRNSSNSLSVSNNKESTASWPMPPPTPPPSEPLPPVPSVQIEENNTIKEEVKPSSPIAQMVSTIPPPRRARSKTMARDEAPNMSNYTTSVHQTNELPRIVSSTEEASSPVPPPRKDLPNLTISQQQEPQQHTKWMDDPESEEEELWCEANGTPKQQQQPQEWKIL
jgi:hypothetical protein